MATDTAAGTPRKVDHFAGRSLAGLIGLAAAGTVFGVLLTLVRLKWSPLERVDHGLAASLNAVVSRDTVLLDFFKIVTNLGGPHLMWGITIVGTVFMLLRRQARLAAYLAVTGVGALILDPTLKIAVGRLRPVVAHPVAHGGGNSFPSGHSLGSIVCYGALLLAFLPSIPYRWRRPVTAVVAALVALVGFSRLALGVHFLSDVIGAWALGAAWLAATAYAFELWRRETGRRTTEPLREGLEPEAARALAAAPEHEASSGTAGRVVGLIVVGWVFLFGVLVGFGALVTRYGHGDLLGDRSVPRWFEAHRTPALTHVSAVWSTAGNTHWIMYVSLVTGAVLLAVTRRWRSVLYLVAALVGELGLFLATAAVIGRPRPEVSHLDAHLPTSSYPSGHVAATLCLYVTIALFAITRSRSWWRWLFLVPAVAMPVLVAWARLYRGMHHPTDVAGSLLLAAGWLTALWYAVRPNEDLSGRRAASRGAVRTAPRGEPAALSHGGAGARRPVRPARG